jgi:hypothetical protein
MTIFTYPMRDCDRRTNWHLLWTVPQTDRGKWDMQRHYKNCPWGEIAEPNDDAKAKREERERLAKDWGGCKFSDNPEIMRPMDHLRGLTYRPRTDGRPGGTISSASHQQRAVEPAPKFTKWREKLDEKFGKPMVDAILHKQGGFEGEPVDARNRELVLAEEVDHAIVADEVGFPVRDIVATLDKSGYCNVDFSSLKFNGSDTRAQLLRLTAMYLAGIAGHELRQTSSRNLDHSFDLKQAARCVDVWFHNDDAGKAQFYAEAKALAWKILTERADDVKKVAAALRERGRLDGLTFYKLVSKPAAAIVQVRTATMPLMIRSSGNAATLGQNDDLQVTWTTGAAVKRMDDSGRPYYEVLELGPKNVRLDRLNSGAPFLASHDSSSLQSVLGVVVKNSARIEDGKRGVATIKLSSRPEVAGVVGDLRDGIIRGISVGYRYHKVQRSSENISDTPVWRVTDWEPLEISATAIQADAGASVRTSEKFVCEVRS